MAPRRRRHSTVMFSLCHQARVLAASLRWIKTKVKTSEDYLSSLYYPHLVALEWVFKTFMRLLLQRVNSRNFKRTSKSFWSNRKTCPLQNQMALFSPFPVVVLFILVDGSWMIWVDLSSDTSTPQMLRWRVVRCSFCALANWDPLQLLLEISKGGPDWVLLEIDDCYTSTVQLCRVICGMLGFFSRKWEENCWDENEPL